MNSCSVASGYDRLATVVECGNTDWTENCYYQENSLLSDSEIEILAALRRNQNGSVARMSSDQAGMYGNLQCRESIGGGS